MKKNTLNTIMKLNKIFIYYIMNGLTGFLSMGGALPFSYFLKGGATTTLTLPNLTTSSEKPKRRNTARRTTARRNTARRTTARRDTGRRTTSRRNTGRRTTARRDTGRRTTARRNTGRRTTARRNTARRTTARRNTGRRTTARRDTGRRTSRRTERKVVEPRKLSTRKRVGEPGKYLCVNGCDKKMKAYYTGKEPSPKGLGYCARCTPLNIVMRGNDGNLWENKKFSKGKRWVKA